MRLTNRSLLALAPLLLGPAGGCASLSPSVAPATPQPTTQAARGVNSYPSQPGAVQLAVHQAQSAPSGDKPPEQGAAPSPVQPAAPKPLPGQLCASLPARPFEMLSELSAEDVVREV